VTYSAPQVYSAPVQAPEVAIQTPQVTYSAPQVYSAPVQAPEVAIQAPQVTYAAPVQAPEVAIQTPQVTYSSPPQYEAPQPVELGATLPLQPSNSAPETVQAPQNSYSAPQVYGVSSDNATAVQGYQQIVEVQATLNNKNDQQLTSDFEGYKSKNDKLSSRTCEVQKKAPVQQQQKYLNQPSLLVQLDITLSLSSNENQTANLNDLGVAACDVMVQMLSGSTQSYQDNWSCSVVKISVSKKRQGSATISTNNIFTPPSESSAMNLTVNILGFIIAILLSMFI